MPAALPATVYHCPDPVLAVGGTWDRLLARSSANTIFLSAGWLRAAWEAFGEGRRLLVVLLGDPDAPVAGGAFTEQGGVVEFLGTGPSDYLDVVFSSDFEESAKPQALCAILRTAMEATPGFRRFHLKNIPEENGTPACLVACSGPLWGTILRVARAPSMEMSAGPEAVKKKSLRRHENGLAKIGQLTCETFSSKEDIEPVLEPFFQQHVERWTGTPFPSLFLDERNREFFRRMVRYLGPSGWLRCTTVKLDGRLLAAHLGSFHAKRFTWYKPTYDPAFAKHSPGEVLLKRLVERAIAEGAEEFDFTIGDEAFKDRFATKVRAIVDVEVTNRRWRSLRTRAKLRLRHLAKNFVRSLGPRDLLSRWRKK
ncbi:MAG: GNAT family N-acetyltransferase [Planctomycetota bacterium]